MDAIVLKVPLKRVNGFYHRYLDQDLIYINDALSEEEQIIVCAHELGHMVLHHDIDSIFLDSPVNTPGKIELEANAFALQLLQGDLNLSNDIPLIDWNANNLALRRRVRFHSNG
jgi:Zn-dependent peptidase ImmA (M78 family)